MLSLWKNKKKQIIAFIGVNSVALTYDYVHVGLKFKVGHSNLISKLDYVHVRRKFLNHEREYSG